MERKVNLDKKIVELQNKIKEEKRTLTDVKFQPKTSCIFELLGNQYNLLTVNDKALLTNILVQLNVYRISSEDLGLDYIIKGFILTDWMDDIKTKLDVLDNKERLIKISKTEAQLTALLSEKEQKSQAFDKLLENLE